MPQDENPIESEDLRGRSEGAQRPDDAAQPDSPAPDRTFWQSARLYLLRAGAVSGAILLVLAIFTGGAASYTSRSEFCNSCHIMEPYYVSWQESSHSDVACVKCHFPPGALEKVRGKMLGLVQLMTYVTQSAGPRPVAEVPDASCLRCHDTRLLSGRVEFHGVPFDHQAHLTKLRRGKQLRCTSCHSQIVQGAHMTVTTSTCFLCHFKDVAFNDGLGTCTRCHEIPQDSFQLGGGVEFSHDLAYKRGVDCASCHGDLIRGNGIVPRERCTVCHNRESDLDRIEDDAFIHEKHVSEHKVDCLSCHLEIQHSFQPDLIEHAASDCKSCHPNQHLEQVRMLAGEGGVTMAAHRGGMTTLRITCLSCHESKSVSSTGTVVWKASVDACATCHEESAAGRLKAYYDELKNSLSAAETALAVARDHLRSDETVAPDSPKMQERLAEMQNDLNFIRVGNGIHNIHYATSLLRELVSELQQVSRELGLAAPSIPFPQEADLFE